MNRLNRPHLLACAIFSERTEFMHRIPIYTIFSMSEIGMALFLWNGVSPRSGWHNQMQIIIYANAFPIGFWDGKCMVYGGAHGGGTKGNQLWWDRDLCQLFSTLDYWRNCRMKENIGTCWGSIYSMPLKLLCRALSNTIRYLELHLRCTIKFGLLENKISIFKIIEFLLPILLSIS